MGSSPIVVPSLIGGKEIVAGSTFAVTSPLTGATCWETSSVSVQDGLLAVEAANEAFAAWRETKPGARQTILFKAATLMEERADELVGYVVAEIGVDQAFGHRMLQVGIGMMRDIAARASTIYGRVPTAAMEGRSAMVWKEPYGVMLGIVPWNAPLVFGVRAAASAIVTGNTTILKGSELAPRSYWALGKVFHDAGVPDGVVNVISCRPEDAPAVVNAIVEQQAVKKVNFTGSANTGRLIAQTCAKNLKPTLMELGGKNCALVLQDADLKKAAEECVIGAFANCGQICMSTDLILIHKDIANTFLEVLKQALIGILGNVEKSAEKLPFVVTANAASRISHLIKDAQTKGAEVFFGGATPPGGKGAQVQPTVIGNLSQGMELNQDEIFGPIVGYEIFSDEAEGVRRMNSFQYGLSSAVFTKDLRRAFAIARKIESGAVHINSMTVHDEPGLPFGGQKHTGWGRFNADEGLDEFLYTKNVVWDD